MSLVSTKERIFVQLEQGVYQKDKSSSLCPEPRYKCHTSRDISSILQRFKSIQLHILEDILRWGPEDRLLDRMYSVMNWVPSIPYIHGGTLSSDNCLL